MKVDTKALRELMQPGSTCHVVSAIELRSLCDAYDALAIIVTRIDYRNDETFREFHDRNNQFRDALTAARKIINPHKHAPTLEGK